MTIEMANRLVQLRRDSGLSQEELAAKLGVSRQAVSKWERAEASPDTDNLMALADLYGVTLDELVRGAPSAPSPTTDEDDEEDEEDDTDEKTGRHGFPHVDSDGFHVNDDGEQVDISWRGIHVKERSGKEVRVGWNGIHVDDTDHHIHLEGEEFAEWKKNRLYRVLKEIPVWMFVIIGYLLLGGSSAGGGTPAG